MFLDSTIIKEFLNSVHPNFVEEIDNESKLYYFLPFQKHPNSFLIIFTGINKKFPKTSFLEIRLCDSINEVFFGRKYIIKLDKEETWKKKVKKTIIWTIKSLDPFVCPRCKSYMTARSNGSGEWFLGCVNFPKCKAIKKIESIIDFEL